VSSLIRTHGSQQPPIGKGYQTGFIVTDGDAGGVSPGLAIIARSIEA